MNVKVGEIRVRWAIVAVLLTTPQALAAAIQIAEPMADHSAKQEGGSWPGRTMPNESTREMERLLNLWQHEEAALINGHLDLVLYRAAELQIPFDGMDELYAACESLAECPSEHELARVMERDWLPRVQQFSAGFKVEGSVWGTHVEAAFDSARSRAKWQSIGNFEPEYLSLPTAFVTWNRQFRTYTVELSSSHEMFYPKSLRLSLARDAEKGAILDCQTDGELSRLTLAGERSAVVERGTGFVKQLLRQRDGGVDYWFQFNQSDSGIPRLLISGVFLDNTVVVFKVRFVSTLATNLDLGIDAFRIRATENCKVIDYRAGVGQARIMTVGKGVDVLESVNRVSAQGPISDDTAREAWNHNGHSTWFSTLIVFSLCFLFSALLVFTVHRLKTVLFL